MIFGKDGLGRPAITMSVALHVGAFVLAVGVPRLLASKSGMGPVYVVDLVSPPGPAGPAAAAPAAAPAPAGPPKATPPAKAPVKPPVPPKKPVEKPIVLPDKNAKKPPDKKAIEKKPVEQKPEPVKTATPPEPEEASGDAADESTAQDNPQAKPAVDPAATKTGGSAPPGAAGTATGTATTAGAGGTGSGPGGGGDEYAFYLSLLKRRIEAAWNRPVYTGADTKSATVKLTLTRTGRVVERLLSKPSGYEPLDRSLLRAVLDAEPFPSFPASLTLDTLPVQIVFDLKPEGADTGEPGD